MNIGSSCFRGENGVAVLSLPFRVVMPDGSTRTDPTQWWLDSEARQASGYIESTLTQDDIDLLFTPEPSMWLEAGYDTGLGWNLAWTPDNVALLTGLYVLAKRASELGINQPCVITDMHGDKHSMTFEQFELLMLAYGAARAAASAGAI